MINVKRESACVWAGFYFNIQDSMLDERISFFKVSLWSWFLKEGDYIARVHSKMTKSKLDAIIWVV